MRFLRVIAVIIATSVSLICADSTSRNYLNRLTSLQNPSISTRSGRVTALDSFDLSFDSFGRRVRLKLEPNHDIVHDDAHVTYLGPDGEVVRREKIDRLSHRVFKGSAWTQWLDGTWKNVGWARVVVRRDGRQPLFEGAYSINHDHHHIQLKDNFMATRHEQDPKLPKSKDEDFMVLWRDSDIAIQPEWHDELRKRDASYDIGCQSDELGFNNDPQHPVHMMTRSDTTFWSTSMDSLFGKRQTDTQPGGGNTGAVNLVSTIGNANGCPTTRKVALVGVATDCTYTAAFNSTESARQNVITQMNTASDLYEKTFNITLGLANLTVSDAQCPTQTNAATPWNVPCSNSADIQARLNLFSQWRGNQKDNNSHWTLLSTCNTGSAVGLAWLGQACVQGSQNSSSGGTSETVAGANFVARTSTEWQVIAHETGHTFGAVHDCTSQTCADANTVNSQQCCPLSSSTCDANQRYIMNPSTSQGITQFSPCTVGNICSAFLRNSVRSTCFTNNKGVTTISGKQCGNGIVEDGEDCDCGGTSGCGNNSCCDATTCKFKNNAVCDDSNEDCCTNCQLTAANTTCRASTGQCDPAETCSGTSPYCPTDVTAPDGQSCGNGLQCAAGQCTSRDQQCKSVMGKYTSGNDTYACDSSSCVISCASPEFGSGVCYGLQQNFLDGTTCGGGGKCSNGQCKGSSAGGEIKSWIDDHKPLVIGLAAGIGGLLLLAILGCCINSCRRRRQPKRAPPPAWPAAQFRGSSDPLMQQQHVQPVFYNAGNGNGVVARGWQPPPPPMGVHYNPPPQPPPAWGRQQSVRYA